MQLDDLVKQQGFKDVEEFNKMISSVDFSKVSINDFNDWKLNDGTKEGLLKLTSAEEG